MFKEVTRSDIFNVLFLFLYVFLLPSPKLFRTCWGNRGGRGVCVCVVGGPGGGARLWGVGGLIPVPNYTPHGLVVLY